MACFYSNINGGLSYRHEPMPMNNMERLARVLAIDFFHDSPNHSLRHWLIDLIQQSADGCAMFDVTDNPLKLNKRTGSVTRRNILHPNWQVREENRHLHPRARSYKFGSVESPQTTNSSSDGRNSLFTAAGLGSYPPETGGIKAASS